jgi:hypothetical protein
MNASFVETLLLAFCKVNVHQPSHFISSILLEEYFMPILFKSLATKALACKLKVDRNSLHVMYLTVLFKTEFPIEI